MCDSDSDDELLANLLASADEPPPPQQESFKDVKSNSTISLTQESQSLKSQELKELDFNFLDDVSEDFFADETLETQAKTSQKSSTLQEENNGNSSDEEDKKYFDKQTYSDYGRDIKNMLKNKESEKESLSFSFKKDNNLHSPNSIRSQKFNKISPKPSSLLDYFTEQQNNKQTVQAHTNLNSDKKKDVYSDPIFGLKIIKPLISSTDLKERMVGRKAVTVSNVKMHLQSMTVSDEDWVIAGVLISQNTRTSQKGNTYCIWQISDLLLDMKRVSVFLFSSAYKTFWKTSVGTVIAILNPSVLDSKGDQDLATLSVDNDQKIMILGSSKDLGRCKSKKKNGDPCTAPINLSSCEYCIYHVKQEYGKYSKRSELQSQGGIGAFGVPNKSKKNLLTSQQRHPEALSFTAIPARRNEAQYKKDCERLALLRGKSQPVEKSRTETKIIPGLKFKTTMMELPKNQVKKDCDKLNMLRDSNVNKSITSSPMQIEKKVNQKFSLSTPKLGTGVKGNIIDFSQPIPKYQIEKAKLNAIMYMKQKGKFEKQDPNKIRPDKQIAKEKGIKRRREEEEDKEEKAKEKIKKAIAVKTRFQEMLEKKSAHDDLIEKHHDEQTEKYFSKLEVKEKMEDKMLSTFKVDCKAVRCNTCKYVAFSASELCKKLQHPFKIIDAVKRFFKCDDCGNRTVTLDRIPTETCKRCSSSKWVRTGMMDERKTQINSFKLCIRGGEEKFIGAAVTDASLNLLVPESD